MPVKAERRTVGSVADCGGLFVPGRPGRKALGDLSEFATDYVLAGITRPTPRPERCTGDIRCTDCARQATRVKGPRADAARYAQGRDAVCSLCYLPGVWAAQSRDGLWLAGPALFELGHSLAVALGGATGPRTLSAQHICCNADAQRAGFLDLRPFLGSDWAAWPATSTAAAARGAGWLARPTRGATWQTLPTLADIRAARATRVGPDGTVGLPF